MLLLIKSPTLPVYWSDNSDKSAVCSSHLDYLWALMIGSMITTVLSGGVFNVQRSRYTRYRTGSMTRGLFQAVLFQLQALTAVALLCCLLFSFEFKLVYSKVLTFKCH